MLPDTVVFADAAAAERRYVSQADPVQSDIAPVVRLNKSDRVPDYADGWPQALLGFLLTPLANRARRGSVFGELSGESVELRVALQSEQVLTKSLPVDRTCALPLGRFLEFVTYLSRDLLGAEPPTLACGIVRVRFEDENDPRLFTAFVRRSGVLGAFFQLDQFPAHL